MSESKHTPGPWRVVVNCQNYEHQPYLIYAGAEHVASIEINQDPNCTHEPNAALIAAAPELLATLEMLKIHLADCRKLDCCPDNYALAAVDAAIAKAKGE